MKPTFTIGIEEEYMTIDPGTRDLRSHIHTEILSKGKIRTNDSVKPEMHQSVIEVGTPVCLNMQEAKENVKGLRRQMIELAQEHDMLLVAAGNKPFSVRGEEKSYSGYWEPTPGEDF